MFRRRNYLGETKRRSNNRRLRAMEAHIQDLEFRLSETLNDVKLHIESRLDGIRCALDIDDISDEELERRLRGAIEGEQGSS